MYYCCSCTSREGYVGKIRHLRKTNNNSFLSITSALENIKRNSPKKFKSEAPYLPCVTINVTSGKGVNKKYVSVNTYRVFIVCFCLFWTPPITYVYVGKVLDLRTYILYKYTVDIFPVGTCNMGAITNNKKVVYLLYIQTWCLPRCIHYTNDKHVYSNIYEYTVHNKTITYCWYLSWKRLCNNKTYFKKKCMKYLFLQDHMHGTIHVGYTWLILQD